MRKQNLRWSLKITLTILPIVLVMIIIFFSLTSSSIISLSLKNMHLSSENCANDLNKWTEQIVSELNIYKKTIEENFSEKEELERFLVSTYEMHESYPMGIYIGDDKGLYADASGWIPDDPDWILTEREWYVDGKDSYDIVFGEPYMDAMLDQTCISVSVRLDYPDAVRVMATDISLDYAYQLAYELVNNAKQNSDIDGAFLVTEKSRMIMADSDHENTGEYLNDRDELYRSINELLDKGSIGQSKIKCGGDTYYVDITATQRTNWYLVTYSNKKTIISYFFKIEIIMAAVAVIVSAILVVLTQRYAQEMKTMYNKAKTDKLTKLLNREGFEENVNALMNEHPAQGILLIMDLDNFKSINDTLGHPVGDKVLIEFAGLLDSFFNRTLDLTSRMGGDEFAVFIGRDVSDINMDALMKKFLGKMKETFDAEYADYNLTASVGGAFVYENAKYAELYNKADIKLYEVKQKGKNGFMV